ncbi:MAG: amino acid-binding protein [Candidatus Competibacteraceae bacterium]|nr:amino acid-binding protein [Candidatus Competibacteraceae bacterium]
MEREFAVLTAIGSDRVGITSDLSEAITQGSCNIEESRMAVLGGEFAIIMLLSGGSASLAAAIDNLPGAGRALGLQIEVKRTTAGEPSASGRPYRLTTVSLDTPGIVHTVTAVLKRHGINVEELETETSAAPWTGAPMFRMEAQVVVPPTVQVSVVRERAQEAAAQPGHRHRVPAGPRRG